MKVLAIETSCDETAVAILEASGDEQSASFKVLGNALLSQVEQHRPYGGVYPMLAKREHLKNLPPLLTKAFEEAGIREQEVDAVAVTSGPGLEPALWVGVNAAKELSLALGKPLVAVNHMEGHILSALAKKEGDTLVIKNTEMPVLALLISGGHTELVLMKKWLEYELIGQTLDDAVGEAFDKVARMLGLPYPGGPEVSKLAEQERDHAKLPFAKDGALRSSASPSAGEWGPGPSEPRRGEVERITLPRPMIDSNTCDFSFAGLKTAVLYLLKEIPDLGEEKKSQIALEFENAVGDVLWKKTAMALDKTGAKTLVIGGGVSANTHIRRIFTEKIRDLPETTLRIPTADLTTDNAVMIGLAGYYRTLRKEFVTEIKASGNLSLA